MNRGFGWMVGLITVAGLTGLPAQADSTVAYCSLSVHDHTVAPTPLEACNFSQYQGNAYVRTADGKQYKFPYKDQDKSFKRMATEDFLRFTKEGEYSLTVMWPSPAIRCKRTDL